MQYCSVLFSYFVETDDAPPPITHAASSTHAADASTANTTANTTDAGPQRPRRRPRRPPVFCGASFSADDAPLTRNANGATCPVAVVAYVITRAKSAHSESHRMSHGHTCTSYAIHDAYICSSTAFIAVQFSIHMFQYDYVVLIINLMRGVNHWPLTVLRSTVEMMPCFMQQAHAAA